MTKTRTDTATTAVTSTTPAAKPSRQSVSRKAAPVASIAPVGPPPPRVSKRDQLAALLLRDEGATLDQMIAVTGWLLHTT